MNSSDDNFQNMIARLQAAKGQPEQLTLATVDIVLAIREPVIARAFEAAAIPHWFTTEIVAMIMRTPEESVAQWLPALLELPMIETFHAHRGWNVHEATRLAVRARLARQSPGEFRESARRAAECFQGNDHNERVE